MTLYEITADKVLHVPQTSFIAEKFKEGADLQRLLRDHVEILAPDTMILSEEFGEWEESKRRIDLLGLDKDANLVVIELKRTGDGSYMDLQAIRYAAMVSTMTFEQVVVAHAAYLRKRDVTDDARTAILDFLDWTEPNELDFAQSVRILLLDEGFSKELTTAVIWLNQRDLDIRCVRVKPYRLDGRLLIDVQQTIPLPEAAEYQIQIRNKVQQERAARSTERDYTKYDVTVDGIVYPGLAKRHAIFRVVQRLCESGVSPEQISSFIPFPVWRSVDGEVDAETFKERSAANAQNEGKTFDERRFFCDEDNLIHANGRTYAFSNQWGRGTKEFMDSLIAAFPEAGVSCVEAS